MPSTAGIVASGSAQLDQWLRANLIAFDERRSSPLANLGTLGAAGNATATGTRRLVNTGAKAFVQLPGVVGNFLSVLAAPGGPLDITGDVCHIWHVRPADITPAALSALGAKFTSTAGNQSWWVGINPTGTVTYTWLDSGGTSRNATSTVALSANGYADGQEFHFALTHDVDNEAGGNDVRFWTSPDATTWTQLGSTVSQAFTTSIFSSATFVEIGTRSAGGASPWQGDIYRYRMNNGIGASGSVSTANVALDIDTSALTDEGATSFTATTGQTVTIGRGTSTGYRAEVVLPGGASRLFNGTSDFLEVADNDALDFSSAQSFSVWALIRRWGAASAGAPVVTKQSGSLSAGGWRLVEPATSNYRMDIGDGTNTALASTPGTTTGQMVLVSGVRNVAADQVTGFANATSGTPVTDATTSTLATAFAVRVGAFSAGTFNHFRLYAWGVYPGALTAAQLAALRDALLVPERAAA